MIPDTSPLPTYADHELASHSVPELMRLLLRNEDRVPRNLIDECARRGDEMAESLGELLHKDYYWGDDQTHGEWWLRYHAVMILGLIPTARAGILLIDFMHRISETENHDLADWLSGAWPVLFRNKPAAVVQQLRKLADDREEDGLLRLDAVCTVIAATRPDSPWPAQSALDWAAAIAFNRDEALVLRSLIGSMLLEFARPAHRRKLESLADMQSDDGRVFGRDDITRAYATGGQAPDWERFDDPWAFFYSPEAFEQRQRDFAEADLYPQDDEDLLPAEATYVRPTSKIGRNDPCPCGSGKKYKKCCLAPES